MSGTAGSSFGPRLILDCDPGGDDALALLAAIAFGELVGVTTVAGNADVEVTTANAEIACAILGYEGDVVRGAARPLVSERPPVGPMPPFSGLSEAGGASSRRRPARAGVDAAGFIVERADEGTWLVATGPLTNVALALRRDPELARRLAGISIMGGSTGVGNVTPVAEFNVWADPEAAHVVLTSGARLRMCGLQVTHEVLVTAAFVEEARRLDTARGRFVARLLEVFIETYPDAFVGEPHAPLHDPCAVLAVTHPHLFAWQDVHVAVELAGTLTRGMTVVDRRDHRPPEAANVEVARGVDARQVLAALTRAVAAVAGRATTPVETILSGSAEAGTGRRVEPGENGWPR